MLKFLVAVAVAAGATTAFADQNVAQVRAADLDLTTAGGQAALQSRLDAAVRAVCDDQYDAGVRVHARCMAEARRSADHGRRVLLASVGKPSRIEIASR